MLDSEIDRIFHDQVGHFEKQEDLERYLAAAGRTAEEIRDEIRPIADLRLRRSLVLSEVANVEHVEAADEEVEAEIGKMTEAAGAQAQQLRELFSSENGKDTIRRNLVTRKTLALLVESATQDGGAPKAAAMKDKPKAKKKASKKTEEATEEAEAPATAE
jgi:trigger factor